MNNDINKYIKGWISGGSETPCGSGSKLSNTEAQCKWIPEMIVKHGVKTVADIGAGDLNWMSMIELPEDVQYQGYDLVPRHNSVKQFDLLVDIPPKVDLLMCIWVLNHMPRLEQLQAMRNIIASGCKYLMITNTPKWNQDYINNLDYLELLELPIYEAELRLIQLRFDI